MLSLAVVVGPLRPYTHSIRDLIENSELLEICACTDYVDRSSIASSGACYNLRLNEHVKRCVLKLQ